MFNKLKNDAPCWCKSGKSYGECHKEFDAKLGELRKRKYRIPSHKMIKNEEQLRGMKESSKLNIAILDYVAENIHEGMTTEEINTLVHTKTLELGGIPAPLNYEGFPKSVCTSIDSQVCHGIPSTEDILEDGDIINVDVSTIYKGYYSDSSRMFMIGNVHPEVKRLVEVTKKAIEVGLEQVKPWKPIGNVGAAINEYVQKEGFSVVREIGGHGVGIEFHEDPYVSYVSDWNTGVIMAPGMAFTIEPMVNMGSADIFIDEDNGWTVYTDDNMPSAQWEVTVVVTEDGYEVITW
ncbi:MAG: methionyl aminopeptidase [Lachnospiraceae bacterium]|nr:methionyl aminopeptidase [Lachnospiraceae bacterium]